MSTLRLNFDDSKVDGATLLCKTLLEQGVEYMFGVVGIPVIEIGIVAQMTGIKYIGMRNEQAASYAAGAVGYMTGRPGCCLAVSGPGMTNCISGLANAWSNCWPMILVAGSCHSQHEGIGGFQEAPQLASAQPFCKYVARPDSITRIPFYVEKCVREAISGRPGAVYLDLPAEMVHGTIPSERVRYPLRCPDPPFTLADPSLINSAIKVILEAKKPLIVVGKGSAYGRAEKEISELVEVLGAPFLPTPMGKGVVPDDHPLCVAASRSTALNQADTVLLLGARLNWILHFGLPPRWQPSSNLKIIQCDIKAEEFHNGVPTTVPLLGHIRSITKQLVDEIKSSHLKDSPKDRWPTWKAQLLKECKENEKQAELRMNNDKVPMSYYRVFKDIRQVLPRDAIIVSEGANTMDIGRTLMPNYYPRHRLDAGTFGTMGVGLGFAIAAALVHPNKTIIAVEGDSAFGFSGMEMETICRYKLPITVVIVNNNGIYQGLKELPHDGSPPPTVLTPDAHYEQLGIAFGGKGFFVDRPAQLAPALKEALEGKVPSVVNVMIAPSADRKPQKFDWLTVPDVHNNPSAPSSSPRSKL